MPSPTRCLTRADVARYVEENVFHPTDGSHPDHARVGIELEWITVALADGAVVPDTLRAALPDPLPGGSRLTFEPGGQLELSGPPLPGVVAACSAMAADAAAARDAVATHGVRLVGVGLDPRGARRRVVDAPRYRAMERYFDTGWPAGRTMMRNTASVQVNLDLGDGDMSTRWHRAHALGPVLAAAFANSPIADGRPTGWRSTRLAVWAAIDPGRTAPAAGADPRAAWARYALGANVMLIRTSDAWSVPICDPMPFARWLDDGHELGWPTRDDFEYHLTTLFPPVRPRGWLELRMIDALPEDLWPVAVAVAHALLDDEEAAAAAAEAAAPVDGWWTVAAREAVAHPTLRAAADRCLRAAVDALGRLGVDPSVTAAVAAYHDAYVARGRCPADDRLREWAARRAAPIPS